MKLSDLKIGTRLSGGIAILLILMAALCGVGLWSLNQLDVAGKQLGTAMRRIQLATEWAGTLDSHAEMMSAYLHTADPVEQKRIEAKSADQTNRDNKIKQELTSLVSTGEESKLLAGIDRTIASYRNVRAQAMELKESGKAAELDALIVDKLRPTMAAYIDAVNQYADNARAVSQAATADAAFASVMGNRIMIGFVLAALVLGVLLGWWLTRSITRPIAHAVRVANLVAGGNLMQRIEVHSKDETGQLLMAMRSMNDSLARTVHGIRAGAETISMAASQILAGNADLSSRTEQQAASLEQTAASMEQLASTVKQNADNAGRANQLASSASDVARRGGQVVAEVVGTMEQIATSSSKIVEIVSVIDGIAFQTNILALNAAVEAARAGQEGKGFAVVAGEVRSLAQRSASAAREIKQLIEDSVDKVGMGSQQVERAGATMQEIVASVKRVTDIMGEIASASEEQSLGIDQVNRAVSQMDDVTQQNAALVEEAAAASNSLHDQAESLVRSASAFKTEARNLSPGAVVDIVAHAHPAGQDMEKIAA